MMGIVFFFTLTTQMAWNNVVFMKGKLLCLLICILKSFHCFRRREMLACLWNWVWYLLVITSHKTKSRSLWVLKCPSCPSFIFYSKRKYTLNDITCQTFCWILIKDILPLRAWWLNISTLVSRRGWSKPRIRKGGLWFWVSHLWPWTCHKWGNGVQIVIPCFIHLRCCWV